MLVRTKERIDSRRMGANAQFTAVLEGNLAVGGAVAVPAGAKVYGKLFKVKKSRRVVGKAELTMGLVRLNVDGSLIEIQTSGVRAVGEAKGRKTVRKAAAGAAVGAMFGGGKGAATGAAVGATAALVTQGDQIEIPSGTLLEFTLAKEVTVGAPVQAPAAVAPEAGPDPVALAMKVAEARTRSGRALLDYSWKQRTELLRKGKSDFVRLELVRYDLDGQPQRTPMSASGSESAEVQELLQELVVLRPYALPSAGNILDFIQSADLTQSSGKFVAVGQSVLQPGDEVRMEIDDRTFAITKANIRTTFRGMPTTAVMEYKSMEGLVYPARARLKVGDELEVVIEAFDITKS